MRIQNHITRLLVTGLFGWCFFATACGLFFTKYPDTYPGSVDAIVHDTAPLVTAIAFYITMLHIFLTLVWFAVISTFKEN